MKKLFISVLTFFLSATVFSQKDSLQLGSYYAEDQIYLNVSFNSLKDQPSSISSSGFSFGFRAGFLKDIILNKQGNLSFAIGLGYGYDSYSHDLKVSTLDNIDQFEVGTGIEANKMIIHNIEFPIEFRWRNSTAKRYKFWRIYPGIRFAYNFSNRFSYIENNQRVDYKNIRSFNNFIYGATLSVGYDAFNVQLFYGLNSFFNDSFVEGESINTKALKIGLIFYIL